MRRANIIISIILLAFTGCYGVMIARLPSRDLPNTLGATFVPWVLAGLLTLLSLMLLIGNIISNSADSPVAIPKRDIFGITGLLLLITAYIKLMGYVGFIPISIVFLAILTWVAGSRKPIGILLFSVLTTCIVYFLFQKFFSVQLPAGIFFSSG
ncbi:MAG: tripartite tricarboxylate transporter TctB family protein [Eudoraea sp.]|nr:tripartite tricarboxylate transporter TctB family protein [Eudoraea sp.]NNK31406.1 tripartite tricarboxylate transporter TctB family protein [Flavobacteriaceae bacterium]